MADKHANMPGMSEPRQEPEQGQVPAKPQQAQKPDPSNELPHVDKEGHHPIPGKS